MERSYRQPTFDWGTAVAQDFTELSVGRRLSRADFTTTLDADHRRSGRCPGRRVTAYLLDANVLIALTVAEQEHHERASVWAAGIDRFLLCPLF